MPVSEIVAEFASVWKRFKHIEALRGISFEVHPGEVLSFIGPNGSGKTTTIRHLLGFYRPNMGAVRVFGRNPLTEFSEIGSRLGIMLEQPGLCDNLTASEYLDFYAGLFGICSSVFRQRSRELLELAGLSDRSNSRIGGFSKGMRQRLSLARCLINQPRFLLLDEPFDGIDVETRRYILDLLPRLAHEGGAAVFVTSHNLPEVDRISDRIAIINRGQIVALDRPDSLRHQATGKKCLVITIRNGPIGKYLDLMRETSGVGYDANTRQLRMETAEVDLDLDGVLRQLLALEISVSSIREERSTLEDVYFSLTQGCEGLPC